MLAVPTSLWLCASGYPDFSFVASDVGGRGEPDPHETLCFLLVRILLTITVGSGGCRDLEAT